MNKINIFYVGRIKIEKGIYSLLELFLKLSNNIHLTVVGSGDLIKVRHPRIKILKFINNETSLIKIYDKNNILILPSYTESYSKVIDESLSRFRPVILFDDIKYIIGKRFGVFSVKRDYRHLQKKINFIIDNYSAIHKKIIQNRLPTRSQFLNDLIKILKKN
jgi:glycosyltransferase involved in cell wall biosynthesis